jgi:serine protease Do
MKGMIAAFSVALFSTLCAPSAVAQSRFDLLTLRGPGSTIGVEVRELDATEAKAAPDGAGAVITSVLRDTPAEKAGFKNGDVVIEFDGEHVRSATQLRRIVEETRPGREVKAIVLRAGSRQTLNVTPETGRPAASAPRVPLPSSAAPQGNLRVRPNSNVPALRPFFDPPPRLGATVSGLTDQLAEYFGVPKGVLVESVATDSPAGRAGLRAGDVIVDVAGKSVTNPADVGTALASGVRDGHVELHVVREKKDLRLTATMPATTPATPFSFRAGKAI